MLRRDAGIAVHHPGGFSRREFVRIGALSTLGLAAPALLEAEARGPQRPNRDVNCIMLFLLGGPSQLDTWDMKPDAPAAIRGPFRPIPTNVSGIRISEIFPRMARRADMYSIVRSVYHTAAAVHDTGHQMLQTGRLFADGVEYPHAGCVAHYINGGPAHVLLPRPMGSTGGNLPHGQTAGFLGSRFDPVVPEPDRGGDLRDAIDLTRESDDTRRKYGRNPFGGSCLMARRLVERGTRFVTINMFDTVFNQPSWDCHGSEPFSPIDAYRTLCGPWFDNGYTSLIEELRERGLYESTVVVAMGEFGRSPQINASGGRDHWPHCWSIVLGGGGIKGGQIVGASDEIGAYPSERPATPAEVVATLYTAMGIPLTATLPGPGGPVPIVPGSARPLSELVS
jgi:hypothetical protein